MEDVNMTVLNYIVSDINLTIARLGINTQLSVVEKKDYADRPYLAIDSTPFQTMPMIFKDIKLEGDIFVREDKNDEDIVKVTIELDYKYHTFVNASNGHQLGTLRYDVNKEFWTKSNGANEKWARSNIWKVQGLEI